MTPLFVGCFYTKNFTNSHVKDVFQTLSRLLGCMLLFFFANVLKTLVAKIMASHFHKEAHFEKMQEALQKVIIIAIPLPIRLPVRHLTAPFVPGQSFLLHVQLYSS